MSRSIRSFKYFSVLVIVCLLLTGLGITPTLPVQAQAQPQQVISPKELISNDGTLKLDGSYSGALDLDGWDVQIDPMYGPIFSPAESAPTGHWENFGSGVGFLNKTVYALLVDGTDVYVGGSFIDVGGQPTIDYLAKWDGSNWSGLGYSYFGGVFGGALTGTVRALAMDGNGNLYAGGSFTYVNNPSPPQLQTAKYIAKWDGSSWSALGSDGANGGSLNGSVYAIATSGTNIYVGGRFTNVNNNGTVLGSADYIAKWDGTNWAALGSNGSGNGSINNYVYSLALYGTDLYVGGNFSDLSNNGTILNQADYIAKWNGSNWSALGSNGSGNGSLDYWVRSIVADSSGNIYAGGYFTDVNNNGTILGEADFIAKWDGTNWSALGSDGAADGPLWSPVESITIDENGNVYAGGQFTDVINDGSTISTADYIAKFDGTNWSALGTNGAGNGSLNNTVYAIAVSGSNIYTGGLFTDINNNSSTLAHADYLALWNGTNWSSIGASVQDGTLNDHVYAVAVKGTDVYIGGNFKDVENHLGINIPEADWIAKWDGTDWSALGSDGYGEGALTGTVAEIAIDESGNVYAGGFFTNVWNAGNEIPEADYIAKFDGTNWSALGSNGAGDGAIPRSLTLYYTGVNEIKVSGSNIYVGGMFENINNNGTILGAADYIAKWDGTNWSALGSNGAGNSSLNDEVRALAVNGTNVYVGGYFTNVNNNGAVLGAADRIARWDGTNWSALGSNGAGDGSINGVVDDIAISGSNIYVGGSFSNVNNNGTILSAADRIAKWDGTNWSALGSNGVGDGSINSNVYSIEIDEIGNLYVGGWFTNVNNNGTVLNAGDYLAKWDGANWSALSSNFEGNGSLNSGVQALGVSGTDLIVAGNFTDVTDYALQIREADYIAAFGLDILPVVQSITRASGNPTSASSVDFTVSFSEDVTGVSTSDPFEDFQLVTSGVSGAVITAVSGSGSVYTVSVNTGSGNGTIRLDVPVGADITDLSGNPLSNLPYTGDESYSINKTLRAILYSTGSQDGWVLESSETSESGGTVDSSSTVLLIGDDASDRQYRSMLSFDTSSLPDTAVITQAVLSLRVNEVLGGGNPIKVFNYFMADMRTGSFGASSALAAQDFGFSPTVAVGPLGALNRGGWYYVDLKTGKSAVNTTGLTQVRLRFSIGDNDNGIANIIKIYSGNSTVKPQLSLWYYVP